MLHFDVDFEWNISIFFLMSVLSIKYCKILLRYFCMFEIMNMLNYLKPTVNNRNAEVKLDPML